MSVLYYAVCGFLVCVSGLPQLDVLLDLATSSTKAPEKPTAITVTPKRDDEPFFRSDYTCVSPLRALYKLHVTARTWHGARARCEAEGAVLNTPGSVLEADAIRYMMGVIPSRHAAVFLGLHNLFGNGDFIDLNGKSVDAVYNLWSDGEPNNSGGVEHCVVLTRDGHLNDVNCDSVFPFFCKKSFDTLTHNPTCETYDVEYKLNKQQSKCYKVHAQPKTWQNAYSTCAAEGSYLAIINSDLEAESLVTLMAEFPPDSIISQSWKSGFHIGFHSLFEEGEFRTVQGQTLEKAGYDDWSVGQPEGTGDSQRCGALLRDGSLDDVACVRRAPFICEHDLAKLDLKKVTSPTTDTATPSANEVTGTTKEPLSKASNAFDLALDECQTLEKAGYDDWSVGQPEGTGDSQRCGALLRDGSLDDVACVRRAPFICEHDLAKLDLKKVTSPTTDTATPSANEVTGTTKEPLSKASNAFDLALDECAEADV